MEHGSAVASIKESYGRVVYSHKTQEKAAERENSKAARLKWLNVVLVFLTFSGVLSAAFGGGRILNSITAVVSGLSLALAIYRLSFDPEKRVLEHRKAANKLLYLRDQYANLVADIKDGALPSPEVRRRRDDLTTQLAQVYADTPATSPRDYGKAQRALGPGEEMTFSEEEVDRFLPPELRGPTAQ